MKCSEGPEKRFFTDEIDRKLKHTKMGTVAMANKKENMNGSQFYMTLRDNISFLDKKHTIFGQVVEGLDVLERINDVVLFRLIHCRVSAMRSFGPMWIFEFFIRLSSMILLTIRRD